MYALSHSPPIQWDWQSRVLNSGTNSCLQTNSDERPAIGIFRRLWAVFHCIIPRTQCQMKLLRVCNVHAEVCDHTLFTSTTWCVDREVTISVDKIRSKIASVLSWMMIYDCHCQSSASVAKVSVYSHRCGLASNATRTELATQENHGILI